jgi:hypothetical protein
MIYWLIIILGVFILSISISNPLYKITIKKFLNNNLLSIFIRISLFLLSILIIFIGLYIESLY